MPEEKKPIQDIKSEDDVISWKIQAQTGAKKSRQWYTIASIVGILLIVYALLTANLIFAFIIVFGAILIVMTDGTKAVSLEVELSDEGVKVGKEFYTYEQFDNFFIIYKPKEDIKNLYLEFKRFVRPQVSGTAKAGRYEWLLWLMNFARTRLSVPLENMNPLVIRRNLLKYLKEDAEKSNIPLSEQLSQMLKF